MGDPEDDDENATTPKKPAPQPEKKPDEAGQQPDKPAEEDGPSESSRVGPHSFPDTGESPKE